MQVGKTALTVSLLVMMLAGLVFGQSASTGTIAGVVTDPSGAVIPGATVELEDTATRVKRSTTTNEAGRYVFVGVLPGRYNLQATAAGFKPVTVPGVEVEVTKSYTINFNLQVGEQVERIEVVATPAVELQTMDATVGSTVGGEMLFLLPNRDRNPSFLLTLQPTAMPQAGGSQAGGQVSGARADQNFFMLDGGDITNGTSGNTDYLAVGGRQEGGMPTPVESIEEFRTAVTNPTASFTGSAGGQIALVTKRGRDTFHGSLYEFHQNSALNANSWTLNRLGRPKTVSRDNRFGASLGGYIPFLPEKARTYFYMHYEGRRQLSAGTYSQAVPSDTLRQGILRFRDAAGNIISYNLATSTACGPEGNQPCDPRGIGMSPVIRALWTQRLPAGNDPAGGDQLNTIGFTSGMGIGTTSEFGVIRLDHSFGPKWQLMASYRYFQEWPENTNQIDIGGFLPGNELGKPAPGGFRPRQPRYAVIGLTGTLTPNLTTETNLSFFRDWWKWQTLGAPPQVPGTQAALSGNLIAPFTTIVWLARQREWSERRIGIRQNISWLKGTHMLRFGGTLQRPHTVFWRNDGQATLTEPLYNIATFEGVVLSNAHRPPICTATRTTNCLPPALVSTWDSLYAQVLGMVDSGTQFLTRSAELRPYPPGTPLLNDVTYPTYSLYVTDTWHIRPNLTLTYGLNWTADMPPYEKNGKQIIAVTQDGSVIDPKAYMQARRDAALNGRVYNPIVGFTPIRNTGRKYPYDPALDQVSPRISLAWTPRFTDGFLGALFGDGKTVLRGGYTRLYDRINGVQKAINPLQGLGYGQSQVCLGPNRNGQCLGSASTNPNTAFRIGVDGSAIPIPPLSPDTRVPFVPGTARVAGANQPYAASVYNIDPYYRPGRNDSLTFTIQREAPGNSVLEIGYVHRRAEGLFSPFEMNQVPFFMRYGGQSFAQAFNAVEAQLRAGAPVTPQPFFEAALAGSRFCTGGSCTAGVASQFASTFLTRNVGSLWSGIQPSFVFGPATPITDQTGRFFFYVADGWSRYNAGFLSYRMRNWRGLSFDANMTFGRSFDTAGRVQNNDTAVSNAYDLRYDYGPSYFDRKFVFNWLGVYQFPFGRSGGNRVLNWLVRDWSLAPVITFNTGLPIEVQDGSCNELGQYWNTCTNAILNQKNTFGHSVHSGIRGDQRTGIATAGDPANRGSGLNLFADPVAVYNAFRPFQVSLDTTSRGGVLRGQNRWNVDLSVVRKIAVTERLSANLHASFFNVFNHVEYGDPGLNLQAPQSFGVISGQFNSPRVIELGLRLEF